MRRFLLVPIVLLSTVHSFADAPEAIVSTPSMASAMIQDFEAISRVSEIAPQDRDGFEKHVQYLEGLAERSVRWRVVGVDPSAFGTWTDKEFKLADTVKLTLFPDVVVELKMPKREQHPGDSMSFTALIDTKIDGKEIAGLPITGFLKKSGAVDIATIPSDDRFLRITPIENNLSLLNRDGNNLVPHLVVEFRPEIESARISGGGDIFVDVEIEDVDPTSNQTEVPTHHVIKPDTD